MSDERFTENDFKEVDMKKDIEYCMTEIPDLGDIGVYSDDVVFDKEFWEKVVKNIREENERYERQCESMMIDPISGKSTASWEYMQKRFTV